MSINTDTSCTAQAGRIVTRTGGFLMSPLLVGISIGMTVLLISCTPGINQAKLKAICLKVHNYCSAKSTYIALGALGWAGGSVALLAKIAYSERVIGVRSDEKVTLNLQKYRGTDHYQKIKFGFVFASIDTSALNEQGNVICPIYHQLDNPLGEGVIAGELTSVTPLYTLLTMAYRTAMIVPSFIFYLGKNCVQACRKKETDWKQVVTKPYDSLRAAVLAPFYGLAFVFANLYTIISPENGRKLVASVELDWNRDSAEGASIPFNRTFGLASGKAKHLSHDMFYAAVCCQIQGFVRVKDNKITEVYGRGMKELESPLPKRYEIVILGEDSRLSLAIGQQEEQN